jgi:hypothetical protein
MNELYKLQNEKDWKTLLVNEHRLQLVNKLYNNADEFLEKFEEKGLLKQRLELSFLDILKISHPAKTTASTAILSYSAKNSNKNLALKFANEAEQQRFLTTVSSKRNFTATTNKVSAFKAITPSLIGLVITAFVTFVVYTDATIIEDGGEVDVSGRKSLYKKLFAWLGETLGSQGAIIAGCLAAFVCIYFIYKNLKTKPNVVVYE